MKTLEERADAYVGHPFEIDEFASVSGKRNAFIDGAREQRNIDMEKFEKWYCKKKCDRKKECLIPMNICYRLGQIVKEIENI